MTDPNARVILMIDDDQELTSPGLGLGTAATAVFPLAFA